METILVATDFSSPAVNAVNYAAALAKFFSARLILVNASPVIISGDPMVTVDMSMVTDAARESLNQIRAGLIAHNYDFGIECYSGIGTPLDVIKTAADHYSAGLIVVGMTGEAGKLKQHLIGSTAVSLAKHVTLPVLIVPENVNYRRIRHISLACDLENTEETTLVYSAKYFANLFDADLEIVTVEKAGKEPELQKSESYSFIEKRLHTLKHKYVSLKEENVETALEYYFKFHNTDLVMVNPKKHKFFQKLFGGSVTKHLAYHSRVPLLVIH